MNRCLMRKRIIGQHGGKGFHTPVGGQDAERRARHGQQNRLRQKLADQAPASCADGSADGKLVLPRRSSCKQQDRDVGAADHQEDKDGSEEEDNRPRKAAQHLFIQRDNLGAHVLRIALRIFFRKTIHQDLHLSLRGGIFRARLQLDEGEPVVVRIGGGQRGQIDVGIAPGETRGDDSYNGVRLVIHFDRLSNHVGARAVLALPEEIAQNGNRRGVSAGRVGGRELATKQGRHAHVVEHVWRIEADIYGDGKFLAGKIFLFFVLQEDIIDGRCLAKLLGLGAVDNQKRPTAIFIAKLHVDHAIGVFVGIWVEEYAIDHAEDGCGRSDSQHQGKNGADGKPRRFEELPESVANILHQGPHAQPPRGDIVNKTRQRHFCSMDGS